MAQIPTREEELQRTSRALRTLSGSNRALLRAGDRQALLLDICHVIVHEAGYRGAAVVQVQPGGAHALTPLAHVGDENAFADLRSRMAAGHEASTEPPSLSWKEQSATAIAIRTGEMCLISDVRNDPRVARSWRDFHRQHGFGAILALPLHVDGSVFGSLTIFAPEPDAFDEFELAPLLETAADLAFGLETLNARDRHAATQEAIRRLMLYDPVTGLPNRSHLRQLLAKGMADSRAARQPLVLVRLAMDRFQEMDQTLGGDFANRIADLVSRRLQQVLQPAEVLAQVAEGEFAVVAPAAGAEQGRRIAKRLVDAVAEPLDVEGMQVDARLAAGIAVFPGHGEDADLLTRRAGIALSSARRGITQVAVFTPDFDAGCSRRVALMADLRKAIPNGELRLYCQPKVDVRERRPCGLEALVRWEHPGRGLLAPGDFIPVAESTGLVTSLTYWVLEDALRQLYAWRESGIEHPVSVNMSAHDLRDGAFLERVSDKLATWGAKPGAVEFELTESALMQDPAKALEILQALKRLEVKLSIDDFGTGYSSLSYLRKLPVDTIKIDQSFVSGLVTDPGCAAIVRSTIDLAHNLKLDVIAEGVEDDATFDALQELGCDAAQGYAISRPMPVAEFSAWLGSHPVH